MEYKYSVAFSFAGEDRVYVEKVAVILKENNISVFYDKFEEIDLWGKDLGVEFDIIYRRNSKFFIPFISKHYKEKIWTHHEIRTAIARAIENKEDYILPVRFDDTQLDGLRSTIGHINISKMLPEELAQKIISKLGSDVKVDIPEKINTQSNSVFLNVYVKGNTVYGFQGVGLSVTVTNKIKENRYFYKPTFKVSQPFRGTSDSFHMFEPLVPISFPVRLEYGQQYSVEYDCKPAFLDMMSKLKGQNVTMIATVMTTVDEKFTSNQINIEDMFYESKK